MKFVYPAFLWSLFALAIPVIIHLFNFRKYKTLYFSSLKFIQHIDQQTRSTQKLKHLLVLLARLLALIALIFAFAQPFIPIKNDSNGGGKPVMAIYIDNSFSMTAKGTEGELLSEALEMARKLIKKAPVETRILLNTNKMDGVEQRLLTKVTALQELDKISPTAMVRNLDDVINWQKAFIETEHATIQRLGVRQFIFLSDFQKQTSRLSRLKNDAINYYYPIAVRPQKSANCYIDSVWFDSPIRKINENNTLFIRIGNSSEEAVQNLELHCLVDRSKRDVFIDIPAKSKTITSINYSDITSGFKKGKITLNDAQLFWDDDFYFSYSINDATSLLIVNGENASPTIERVYKVEPFYKTSVINQQSCTLDAIKKADLIILNGLNNIPSGLRENLVGFSEAGGSIAFFPGEKLNFSDWNTCLNKLNLPNLGALNNSGTKIKKLNYDDPFFKGMFEKEKEDVRFPAVTKAYQINTTGQHLNLIQLQNSSPLFLRAAGKQATFLFSSCLTPDFGSFTTNALYPSILLRMAEMSQRKAPNNLIIGKDASFPVYASYNASSPIHLLKDKIDFIPEVIDNGFNSELSLSGKEALTLLEAGNYSLKNEKSVGYLSLNYDRSESETTYLTEQEIKTGLENQAIKNIQLSEIKNGQSNTQVELEKPYEYWKLCLFLALIFLIAEMILLKLWKN
ncbi:MAG: BatA domain-containing protein [Crocinitomicaceae bacterium]|nr:BatA domain-containing protein [Crocinitomicaceae bacterium]